MMVYMLDNAYHWENHESSIQRLQQEVECVLAEKGYFLKHMIVDGVTLYTDHYQYLADNLDRVERVEVVLITKEELCDEIYSSLNDYLTRSMPLINDLVTELYRGENNRSTWQTLAELVEGLQWILQSVHFINDTKRDALFPTGEALEESLKTLLEGMNHSDLTTIGDVIHYEIIPYLESIQRVYQNNPV